MLKGHVAFQSALLPCCLFPVQFAILCLSDVIFFVNYFYVVEHVRCSVLALLAQSSQNNFPALFLAMSIFFGGLLHSPPLCSIIYALQLAILCSISLHRSGPSFSGFLRLLNLSPCNPFSGPRFKLASFCAKATREPDDASFGYFARTHTKMSVLFSL